MPAALRIEVLGPLPGAEGAGASLGVARADGEGPQPAMLLPVPETVAADPVRLEALERDLERAADLLQHPHVLPSLGLATAEGRTWRVAALGDGEPLAGLLAAGPLPPATAARVVADACEAVQFAHHEGEEGAPVVHGHLRPESLVISRSGVTLVGGFGDAVAEAARPLPVRLPYVAPEQIDGAAASPATDVFLLGALLRACLGERPGPLAEVAARALSRKPEDRYRAPAELGAAIAQAAGDLAPRAEVAAHLAMVLAARAAPADLVRTADIVREPPRPPPPADLVRTADIVVEPPRLPAPDLVSTRDLMGEGSPPFMTTRPPAADATRRPASRRRFAAAAAVVAVAGLAVGYLLGQRVEDEAHSASTPAAPQLAQAALELSPAPPPPAPPVQVREREPLPAPAQVEVAVVEAPAVPAPAAPSIDVSSDPPADVFLDGQRLGRSPVSRAVSRGRHKVRIADRSLGIEMARTVEVNGPHTKVRFTVGRSRLTVSAPDGAAVLLDGRRLGTGSVEDVEIFEGRHRLRVTLGPATHEHLFEVRSGESYAYQVEKTISP